MSLYRSTHANLNAILQQDAATNADQQAQLNNALRLLGKWRSVLLQNTLLNHHGTLVLDGPLEGLEFLRQSAEGCHIAKLLGCYEQPLQPYIAQAIGHRYPLVLNIGCAEGYYAVGMARRMPGTRFLAHDTNPGAQAVCHELAAKNGVAESIEVGGQFEPADFARFAGQQVLVLCDIEGAEAELLDPRVSPALRGMDLIVESHEVLRPGITRELTERFQATHEITRIDDDGQRSLPKAPDWYKNMAHLDQLLAVWEWRSGPTPWLVMRAHDQHRVT